MVFCRVFDCMKRRTKLNQANMLDKHILHNLHSFKPITWIDILRRMFIQNGKVKIQENWILRFFQFWKSQLKSGKVFKHQTPLNLQRISMKNTVIFCFWILLAHDRTSFREPFCVFMAYFLSKTDWNFRYLLWQEQC